MNYQNLLSNKALSIKPSEIRAFFDYARTIPNCISLGVGEPDFKTPYQVRNAGIKALEESRTWYTSNSGILELKEEITKYLSRRFSLEYSTDEILVTVGGSEAIDLFLRAVINPGDEVIIPTPSYVSYHPLAELYGAKVVECETTVENNFLLTKEALISKLTNKTKAIILTYPSNPTGAILDKKTLNDLAEVLKDRDILILADEIYAELTYNKKHLSVANNPILKPKTVLVNGFSKSYAMTGWRLGYICADKSLIEVMNKIHQYSIICASSISQIAAITALRCCDEEIAKMLQDYDTRRRLVVSEFNKLGLTCTTPEGAFYVFPSIKSTNMTSMEFSKKLLKAKKVAVVPGSAFGKSGEGYIRVSYSYSIRHLKEALKRIAEFLQEIDA